MADHKMTDDEIKTILNGKRILFVDDMPRTLAYIPDLLVKRYGAVLGGPIIKDLVRARKILESNEPRIDAVVLDLNMEAGNREGFDTRLKVPPMNEGQLLGVWLAQRKIPYLYLTGVAEAFDYGLPGQKEVIVLSKFDDPTLVAYSLADMLGRQN